jgi:hypothetical protein
MSAEQQLKLVVMDIVGDTIRHIIAPPPMAFQNMTISDIIEAARSTYGLRQNDTPYNQKSQVNLDWKTRQRAQLAYTLC